MPFKSEKQRRYLWLKHPDIAKRWADEYPNKKKLPMYANKKETEKTTEKAAVNKNVTLSDNIDSLIWRVSFAYRTKLADSILKEIKMPQRETPTYAGQPEQEIDKKETELQNGHCGETTEENHENTKNPAVNPILQKLSGVLSERIRQALADREAGQSKKVPKNMGLPLYPQQPSNNFVIPPPMGMAAPQGQQMAQGPAPQGQPQQPTPNQYAPVGDSNSPNANPINSYGGLASNGAVNGNAAFGTANSLETRVACDIYYKHAANTMAIPSIICGEEKMAGVRDAVLLSLPLATGALGAYLGGRKGHNNWLANETRNDPGGVTSAMNGAIVGGTAGLGLGIIPALIDKYELRDGKINLRQSYLKRWKGHHILDHLIEDDKTEEKASAQKCSCGCGQKVNECTCPPSCSCRQKSGSCYGIKKKASRSEALAKLMSVDAVNPEDVEYYNEEYEEELGEQRKAAAIGLWDRIRAKRQRGEKPAKPGDKDYPDSRSWKKVTSLNKKSASSPAWQRAAGKNEEGGLNEKGRKSYERETGGNLKAPVTEKNPSGERAKRQNSFCARMCGMRRVNTGKSTAKDPDSRINKSLRKWRCKCSSAAALNIYEKRALSPEAENAIVHGTGLVGSGAIGGAAGLLPSYGVKALMNSFGMIPDAQTNPVGNFAANAISNLPTLAGTTAGMMLYDKYIMQPMREREEKRKREEAQQQFMQQLMEKRFSAKRASSSLDRILATALVSAAGGLALGGYPGLKLQEMSERAGNSDYTNFVVGKAPIALGSAVSAGLYNYMQDHAAAKNKKPKKAPQGSKSYLQYLVH